MMVQARRQLITISLYVEASEPEIDRILDQIKTQVNPAKLCGKTLKGAAVTVQDYTPSMSEIVMP